MRDYNKLFNTVCRYCLEKLEENDHKEDWEKMYLNDLYKGLKEERKEYDYEYDLISKINENRHIEAIYELADEINYCAMLMIKHFDMAEEREKNGVD